MIIVTGAAGLIGSAVIRQLNSQGREDLILVDHLGCSNKWKNLNSLKFYSYIEKDEFLCHLKQANEGQESKEWRSLGKIQTIIHLGAQSSTEEKNASYLIANNYRYSMHLAQFAENNNIRMVYASSAATYGDGRLGFSDDIDKLDTLHPLNAYGYSKHIFDLWLKQKYFKPSFAGVKYFNVYGPNEYHKGSMQSIVLKAYDQIKETSKLKLFKSYHPDYKNGYQKRDFLYVDDAAKMTVYLALENTKANGVFNAGSAVASTWLDMAYAIFEPMKKIKKARVQFIDMPPHLKDKYQYYTCAPMQSLKQTGYAQEPVTLREGVREYISNYLMTGKLHA